MTSLKAADLFDISGKVALVTGGSTGIGRMIATGLASNGVKVWICSRKQPLLEEGRAEIAKFGECRAIQADVSTREGIETVAAELEANEERLDILVNNAGTTWGAPIETYPETAWDRVMNLNMKGTFYLTQRLLPLLEKGATPDDFSRVINFSSVAAQLASDASAIGYNVSKAGVEQMTRVMARGLGKHRITVNCISPGWFPTRMNGVLPDEDRQAWVDNTPAGRFGDTADMTGLVLFLTSRGGAYINGQTIVTDGGQTL